MKIKVYHQGKIFEIFDAKVLEGIYAPILGDPYGIARI